MHFTLFVPWLVKGGADRCGLDVIQAVKEQYPEAIVETVICRANRSGNVWKHKFEKFGTVIDLSAHWYNNTTCQAILDYLREKHPSHIMINNAHDVYNMLPSVRTACPNSFISCLLHMELPGAWDFPSTVVQYSYTLDKVFTVSEKLAKSMVKKGLPEEKVAPIHWFGFKDTPKKVFSDSEIRQKIGIDDPRKKIILFPFRLSNQKRPELIISIMGYLSKHMNCVGVVAGSGDREAYVRKAAEKTGLDVKWLGPVDPDDMHHLYQVAFCAVTPSADEGIPLTYFECLQVGCPVVATNVGAVSELLNNGNSVLVPFKEDVKEQSQLIAAPILALNKRPEVANKLVTNGKESIERNKNYSNWKELLMKNIPPTVISFGSHSPHNPPTKEKVFVIGSPFTGLEQVSRILSSIGFHAYKMEPSMRDYAYFDNLPPIWEKVGQFDSFAEEPFNIGDFYQKAFDRFPTSKFILTTTNKEVWKKEFFKKYKQVFGRTVDEDWWTWYDRRNAQILAFFHNRNSIHRLLHLKVDIEPEEVLFERIKSFTGV